MTFQPYRSNYFALSLLSPFISKVAKDLTKQQHLILLAIMAFLTTEMYKFPYGYTYGNTWGTSLLFFVLLFLIGGYFKKYGFFFSRYRKSILGGWLLCLFFAMSYSGITEVNGTSFALVTHAPYHSWTLITSILFFQWFIGIKIKKSYFTKLLCNCAPFTLAVYLIQEHPMVRPKLWGELVVLNAENVNSLVFIVMYITIPIGIFVSCILIDYLITKIYPPLSCTNEWRITL